MGRKNIKNEVSQLSQLSHFLASCHNLKMLIYRNIARRMTSVTRMTQQKLNMFLRNIEFPVKTISDFFNLATHNPTIIPPFRCSFADALRLCFANQIFGGVLFRQ